MSKLSLLAIAAALALAGELALPQTAHATPNAASAATGSDFKPAQTVALMAAIGDRVELVRTLKLSSGKAEPYKRKTMQFSNQALNHAVLRGMDKALSDDEPDAKHVLLEWNSPPDLAAKMAKVNGKERQALVEGTLIEQLKGTPDRQSWDRIEVIVPAYSDLEQEGMGNKLSGIGVYVQGQQQMLFEDDAMTDGAGAARTETEGDYRTVNPKTGETAHSPTYVAPFMYFERLTFDAKTMALIKRQRFYDNTKYADPDSTALDVGSQMTGQEMVAKMVESVEHSAYKSIRQVNSQVTVTEPVPVSAPAPASSPR
jgi:hypothetical protein